MAYTPEQKKEIFDTIFKRIEQGEALRTILLEDTMPSSQTFFIWIDADEDESKRYVRATELRADALVEDILLISDDQEGDVYKDSDGNEQTNHNVINRARLRVDSRKWLAGKLRPKKYGDQSKLTIDGTLGVVKKKDMSGYSDEDLKAITDIADKYEDKK